MTRQEIHGGQLHVVLDVSAPDAKEVILHVQHQVMGGEHVQWEWVELEQPQQGVPWHHGYVDEDVIITAVI